MRASPGAIKGRRLFSSDPRSLVKRNAKLLYFSCERFSLDSQDECCLGLIACRGAQYIGDVSFFRFVERRQRLSAGAFRCFRLWWDRGWTWCHRADDSPRRFRICQAAGIDDRATNDLFELAHVARPVVLIEHVEQRLGWAGDRILVHLRSDL